MQHRSYQKELIDLGPDYYTAAEYEHCLRMLFRVNRLFGFLSSTRHILKKYALRGTVVDVGCGGGLGVLALGRQFPELQFTGVDISEEAIRLAKRTLASQAVTVPNVSFQLLTKPEFEQPPNSVDVVLATLLCHHLTNDELLIFLQKTLQAARQAVILNDLHRHPLAYACYRVLSPLLFRNRLITHDGLLSIRRGFTRREWVALLKQANITHYQIKWGFPFRWRVVLWKNS
jgi:2-polyprenyl-3-methyl-5-hydroxy-6-metoxy-1,4-benzoquinol methylase